MMMVSLQEEDEELEREWNKTPTNGTIIEEDGDDFDDDGETVEPWRTVDSDEAPATFRDYDDVDHDAAVKIQSKYRGYRTRKHFVDRQC